MRTANATTWEQVDALEAGRAFLDRSAERALIVRGADARGWLGDLVTADIATLRPGIARRSLLLTATGRIQADLWIAATDADRFLVVQSADQPSPVGGVLRPYVLSSDVRLDDVTGSLAMLVLPGPDEIFAGPLADRPALVRSIVERGYREVSEAAWEIWRVGLGDPRMGADFGPGDLPAEAGLERLIDLEKGCFLGQESVAKVRNLGHPPTILRHLRAGPGVAAGTPVLDEAGIGVGRVTSAAVGRDGGTVLIARVSWSASEAALDPSGGTRGSHPQR
jgi:tRNA-modifying protein YgfZ